MFVKFLAHVGITLCLTFGVAGILAGIDRADRGQFMICGALLFGSAIIALAILSGKPRTPD